MSEIIDRAAAAAEAVDPSLWVGEDRAAYYRSVAVAVLEALRTPTLRMMSEGAAAMPHYDPDRDDAETVWKAMIDEALK